MSLKIIVCLPFFLYACTAKKHLKIEFEKNYKRVQQERKANKSSGQFFSWSHTPYEKEDDFLDCFIKYTKQNNPKLLYHIANTENLESLTTTYNDSTFFAMEHFLSGLRFSMLFQDSLIENILADFDENQPDSISAPYPYSATITTGFYGNNPKYKIELPDSIKWALSDANNFYIIPHKVIYPIRGYLSKCKNYLYIYFNRVYTSSNKEISSSFLYKIVIQIKPNLVCLGMLHFGLTPVTDFLPYQAKKGKWHYGF